MSESLDHLLKSHGLRTTSQRRQIVEVFSESDYALSQSDISSKLPKDFDRVTLYRVLKSFEEKGLIHVIPDAAGESRYALCQHDGHDHNHDDEHLHFTCTECGKTTCIDGKPIPMGQIPDGYRVQTVSVVMKGECADCSN